jgi:hypothetical protein
MREAMLPAEILTAILTAAALFSCADNAMHKPSPEKYEKLRFQRDGGGHISFTLSPTEPGNSFTVKVDRLNFRDTTITITLTGDDLSRDALAALSETFLGKNTITGDFAQPTLPTGTWARWYAIQGDAETEITDRELRDKLLDLENIVRNRLPSAEPGLK